MRKDTKIILGIIVSILLYFSVTEKWLGSDHQAWRLIVDSDGRGYYAYLPAIFIYQDLNFDFVFRDEATIYGGMAGYPMLATFQRGNKYFAGEALLLIPLFSKQGIHWSYYGVALAADTITRHIEADTKIKLTDVSWKLEFPNKLRGTDYDLGDLLNLLFILPYKKMAYPVYSFSNESTSSHPRLLVIADSFYWSIYNERVFAKIFSNQTYWYYSGNIIPSGISEATHAFDLNLLKELDKYDIILLLQSSSNYQNLGVNFMELFNTELKRHKRYRQKINKIIHNNVFFLECAKHISVEKKISNDSAISVLADSLEEKRFDQVSNYKINMRKDPAWLKQLEEKSKAANISLERLMENEAERMYEDDFDKTFIKNHN